MAIEHKAKPITLAEWLTVDQVRSRVAVNPRYPLTRAAVYAWVRRGLLPAYRIPGYRGLLFRATEVAAFQRRPAGNPNFLLRKLNSG